MESLSAQSSSASGSVATCGVRAPPHDGVLVALPGAAWRRAASPLACRSGWVWWWVVSGRGAPHQPLSRRPCLPSCSRQRAEVSGLRAVRTEVTDGLRPACAREGEVVDQKSAAATVPQAVGRRVGRGTQGTEEGLL